jgi:glycosyltransferase involved in cell wall biosynthesis
MAERNIFDIVFLVKSLNCGIGGMESHQKAFIRYFGNYKWCRRFFIFEQYASSVRVSSCIKGSIFHLKDFLTTEDSILSIKEYLSYSVLVFSNDFWWIEKISLLKKYWPWAKLMIRSGGNDIELAPWNVGKLTYSNRLQKCLNTLKDCDLIIANSNFTVNRFISKGITKDKIAIIRGGVDSSYTKYLIKNKIQLKEDIRSRHNIQAPKIGVFACRMVPFKGIELALDALSISSVKKSVHLLFVGDGPLRQSIQQKCCDKKLSVTFLGIQSNAATLRVIAGSDFLINTSLEYETEYKGHPYIHTETMGRSMMEALMVHTPIIATNVGGIPQLFHENSNIGELTECNVLAISLALEKMCATPPDLSAYKYTKYEWNYVFMMYITLFENLLNRAL